MMGRELIEIPRRYRKATVAKSDLQKKERALLDDVIGARRSVLFTGRPGTGKTHLMACVFNELDEDFGKVWIDANGYVSEHYTRKRLRTTDAMELQENWWRVALRPRLLCIDDLGAEEDSEQAQAIMTRVLMHRYNNEMWTIITTNLSGEQLKDRYGERIISRIYEDYTVVVMRGKDRRRERFGDVIEL